MANVKFKMPKLHKGKIYHNDMADVILDSEAFLTLKDTKEVLWYDPMRGIYRFNGETRIEQITQYTLSKIGLSGEATRNFMNQVIGYIQRETYIDREELDSNHDVRIVKNGALDLNTGKLYPHSKDFKSTIKIPVEYIPDAKCPLIDKFISEVVEPKDMPLLYEIPAWCLMFDYHIQRMVVLLGEGSNGKSTYLQLITRLLGSENCSSYSMQSLVNNRFSMAGLYGKLANMHADLTSTTLRQTGPLKMLTGGDTIEAEKKHKDFFTFINTAKLIFSANQPPAITEDTMAIWRRFIIIDFPNQFLGSSETKNLISILISARELSGFMNKMLVGLGRLKKHGGFSYSRSIDDTRSKYLLASSPTEAFIEECCTFGSFSVITKKELYDAFMKFCGEKKIPGLNIKAFGRKVKHMYQPREERDASYQDCWRGIELRR